ncbi:MAG: CCDC90 family protein [Desulfovibrionaceae bacterium]|nr:CCDC90 family protein [Desulfovibrionaceae bacterium]
MSAVPLNFDTLAYVKQLEAVGVPREQAEVQAEALRAIIDEKLATKLDVAELKRDIKELDAKVESVRAQLQADMSQLRIDTTRDLRELEMRMLIKLGGMMAASIAVVAALVKLL